jgi:signal peptidase II
MTDATNDITLPGGAYRPGAQIDADSDTMRREDAEPLGDPPLRSRRLEIWLPVFIVLLDQLTKALVRSAVPLHSSVTIVPGFVDFTHVRNTGAAFGFLNAVEFPFKSVVIAVSATAALIGVGMYAASLAHHQLAARTGLALIIGGAAGNLMDRIVTGSVVDFVDVYWGTHHFWAFNVADSAITIGVAIMILDMLEVRTHVSKAV